MSASNPMEAQVRNAMKYFPSILIVVTTLTVTALDAQAVQVMDATSVQMQWDPATGPVDGYAVFVMRNGGAMSSTPETTVSGTSVNLSGSAGDVLVVHVAALSTDGEVGPLSEASNPIEFVAAPPAPSDRDGDGIPDGGDAFPDDPREGADSDGDGVGDNADAFPNDPTRTTQDESPSEDSPALCELERNIAAGSTALQSSEYQGGQFPASLALDGDPGNFTHTGTGQGPAVWQVDLGEPHAIREVVLHNRDGCCSARLRDISLEVLDDIGRLQFRSALINPENVLRDPAELRLDLSDHAVTGRIVRVTRTPDPDLSGSEGRGNGDESTVLSLGEVEIYGCTSETPDLDRDHDTVPDREDAFPDDMHETADTDGDGIGDRADAFPSDPTESADSDGDGVGDRADAYPNDPGRSTASNGDGGDNAPPDSGADAEPLYAEDFEEYADGASPRGWLDTGANNSMIQAPRLFETFALTDGSVAFGTESTATNIHSHLVVDDSPAWSSYEVSGVLSIESPRAGIGITLYSDYPSSDHYYRLRRYGTGSFRLAPHAERRVRCAGSTNTDVVPTPGAWYRFRVQALPEGSGTRIRASVWLEDDAEPERWQIDCVDKKGTFERGTLGLWSMGAGLKLWDDFEVYQLER